MALTRTTTRAAASLFAALWACSDVPSPAKSPSSGAPSASVAEPSVAAKVDVRDLAFPENFRRGPPKVLSPADRDADVRVAIHALTRGYGGYRHHAPGTMETLERDVRALAARDDLTTALAFCHALGDALWVVPDAHLGAFFDNGICGEQKAAGMPVGSVGENVARRGSAPWMGLRVIGNGRPVVVIGIASFPFHEDPSWQGYTEVLAQLHQEVAVVVDLRGNGGGDDARGFELANLLTGRQLPPAAVRTYARQTPETLQLMLNQLEYHARTSEDGASFLAARIADQRDLLARAIRGELPEEAVHEFPRTPPGSAPAAFAGPVHVVVDRGCASSCESTLLGLGAHPRVRVFGERTGGFLHFGDVGLLLLPRSRVGLDIPTKYSEFEGGARYERVGIDVDVEVPPGRDALQVALDALPAAGSQD